MKHTGGLLGHHQFKSKRKSQPRVPNIYCHCVNCSHYIVEAVLSLEDTPSVIVMSAKILNIFSNMVNITDSIKVLLNICDL